MSKSVSESGTEPFDQPRAFVTQFRLAVDGGAAKERVFVSSSDHAVVGTHEGCELVLDDRTVSRFHCEISVRDGRAFVRDLGSKNGTLVDGVSVLEAHLHDGARLTVGHTTMHFHIGGEVAIPLSRTEQFGQLVGRSAQMRHVFALLERAAQSKATLLIEGETGTGKEAAAESVHQLGERRDKPFVVVDCSALPPHLLESELFGHEKGAFTGAAARRLGAFESAQGGTVFLDEIGELSPDLQPKLLRVLERQEVKRVGADRYQKIDARIIAATHRNLRSDVNSKRFRSDLYYRLAVVLVTLPPLRERVEDLPTLVERLLASLDAAKRSEAARLRTPAFIAELAAHRWPGNVRELRNYLERSLALSGTASPSGAATGPASYKEARERWERAYVEELLRAAGGNVAAAAREAKLDRAAFYRLLWRHGMR